MEDKIWLHCVTDDCDGRPFCATQEDLDLAGGWIECEYCGCPCKPLPTLTDIYSAGYVSMNSNKYHLNPLSGEYSKLVEPGLVVTIVVEQATRYLAHAFSVKAHWLNCVGSRTHVNFKFDDILQMEGYVKKLRGVS